MFDLACPMNNMKYNFIETLTIAASFHLTHPVESVCDQVGQSPVEVHGCQAALVAVLRRYQFGQAAVHGLRHATDV